MVQNRLNILFLLDPELCVSIHIVRDEGRSLEEYKKLLSTKSLEPLQTFNVELGTSAGEALMTP